jgi:hypothetical protein
MIRTSNLSQKKMAMLHGKLSSLEMSERLGAPPSTIRKQLMRFNRIPERIEKLEAEIARLREVHAIYLAAKEERKRNTKVGLQPNGKFYKGLRLTQRRPWRYGKQVEDATRGQT